MRIDHNYAISLESIVRNVFNYNDRGGMGGFIDADHFERAPFDAALIAISPLWNNANSDKVGEFLLKWKYELRENENEDADIGQYVKELRSLVNELKQR